MLRCTEIWMSRYGTLSSVRAVSTDVRLDIPVALGEVRVQVVKWPRIYVHYRGIVLQNDFRCWSEEFRLLVLRSPRVIEVLSRLVSERGAPVLLRSDNGA